MYDRSALELLVKRSEGCPISKRFCSINVQGFAVGNWLRSEVSLEDEAG